MWTLSPVTFDDLPGWDLDEHAAALAAFSCQRFKPDSEQYRTGSLGIDPRWNMPLVDAALKSAAVQNPKQFFEENFRPYLIANAEHTRGKVTGFYEPEVDARLKPDSIFKTPILKRPTDLVSLDANNRPADVPDDYRFGRRLSSGVIDAYFDRGEIENGALEGRGLEIAYLADPVDAFFIHIQGAASLKLEDGKALRITFDGKTGHPFTAIGKLLVDRGEIAAPEISMMTIRQWLADHPSQSTALMQENRSYIFFKSLAPSHDDLGPIAAAKVPLTANRSLAVDRLIHTFSTPIYVDADSVNDRRFSQLMIAQETGTAIVGPARGDLFFGTGESAGRAASAVNTPCDFYVLVAKDAPRNFENVQLI